MRSTPPRDPFADNDPMRDHEPPAAPAAAAAPPPAPTPPPEAPGAHQCDSGWKTVTDAYVARQLGREDLAQDLLTRRARDFVYPCRQCNPDLFFRWIGGHLDPDHDRLDCRECQQAASGERRRPSGRQGQATNRRAAPPQRADLA